MVFSQTQKDKIVDLYNENNNYSEVSRISNIPKTTVIRVVKNFKKRKNNTRKIGSGRKNSLKNGEKLKIKKIINKNQKMASPAIKKKLNLNVSYKTIRNVLGELGYKCKKPLKKPMLTKSHMVSRLNWGNININKTQEDWKQVLWSNESKFMLYSNGGAKKVYIKPGEELKKDAYLETKKFGGGSVMVWGCFSASGVGNLTFVDGSVNSIKYIEILSDNLLNSITKLNVSAPIFQQDNAPCHISKLTKQYFKDNKSDIMEWPEQSPDLNPTENFWGIIKARLTTKNIKTISELKTEILIKWNKITVQETEKLA